jgi:uncharacterized protein YaaQ
MKLIIAIIQDADNDRVSAALTDEKYRVTFIASTGGFLRSGRSTLLIGTEEDRVARALEIIRETSTQPKNENEKRATVFVVDVAKFTQL